jgi:hypothetical protein
MLKRVAVVEADDEGSAQTSPSSPSSSSSSSSALGGHHHHHQQVKMRHGGGTARGSARCSSGTAGPLAPAAVHDWSSDDDHCFAFGTSSTPTSTSTSTSTSTVDNVAEEAHRANILRMENILGSLLQSPMSRDIRQFCELVKVSVVETSE